MLKSEVKMCSKSSGFGSPLGLIHLERNPPVRPIAGCRDRSPAERLSHQNCGLAGWMAAAQKIGTQNGTLVNESKDRNPHRPGTFMVVS